MIPAPNGLETIHGKKQVPAFRTPADILSGNGPPIDYTLTLIPNFETELKPSRQCRA